MSETAIEWTHAPGFVGKSWNPVVGCTSAGDECTFCYARELHERRRHADWEGKPKQYERPFREVQILPARFTEPLRWRSPTAVFVNSQSDLFHESVPNDVLRQLFAVMALTPQHRYLILTKRAQRMHDFMRLETLNSVMEAALTFEGEDKKRVLAAFANYPTPPAWPLKNVGLGVSAGHQKAADERVPLLARTPASMRFISAEPLLGMIDFFGTLDAPGPAVTEVGSHYVETDYGTEYTQDLDIAIDWILAGGESGKEAGVRPMHPAWLRRLDDDCAEHGVAFFDKQDGAFELVAEGPCLIDSAAKDVSQFTALNTDGERLPLALRDDLPEGYALMHRATGRKAKSDKPRTREFPMPFFEVSV